MGWKSPEDHVAYLEAKVEVLEEALRQRSRELQRLQRLLCPEDLLQLSRIACGLPPLPRKAYDLELWTETTELTPADVEETLKDLWGSLAVVEGEDDDDA